MCVKLKRCWCKVVHAGGVTTAVNNSQRKHHREHNPVTHLLSLFNPSEVKWAEIQ